MGGDIPLGGQAQRASEAGVVTVCALAGLRPPRAGRRVLATAARVWRRGLAWRRLPAWLELATIGLGYAAYSLVRGNLPLSREAAFAHARHLWLAERWMHVDIEHSLNHFVTAHSLLANATGYYYGLLHFIVTPLVLAWLYLRRPAAFPRMRSALVLATTGATLVFWRWPLAPPRFAVPGMTDILVTHNILDAGDPHGVSGMVDLYAAMPSLHVGWATWCAVVIVIATRSRWRHLAWLYPAATTFVVMASANHFVLDAAGGVAIIMAGVLVTRRRLPAHIPETPAMPAEPTLHAVPRQ
jgi:PAP2 superfamily